MVRRLVGYERFDTEEEQLWLEDLYTNLVRIFANCFQPTMKLLSKEQVNDHTRREYDIPRTPLQRVIESGAGDKYKLQQLTNLYNQISPLTLKRNLDRELANRPTFMEAASA